jgi:cytochrome subunit of sulfide dehydrogenase
MQQKPRFYTPATAMVVASLLLSFKPVSAHHEGGEHDIPRTIALRQAAEDGPGAPRPGAQAVGDGARLAATCTGCHGTNGQTVGGALPALAGQPKAALLASLMAFKSGERRATVMTQLAKGYSDEDLERIAAFFAAQKPAAAAGS